MSVKLKKCFIQEELFYYSTSFDINDFAGEGYFWLQIYDKDKNMLFDQPFRSAIQSPKESEILEEVQIQFNILSKVIL